MGDLGVHQSNRASLPSTNPTHSFWQTSHPNAIANHRSTKSLPGKTQIAIIGSGITGVFAAEEILSKSSDIDVLVLEARTTCSGATGRNGGHLQPNLYDQSSVATLFEALNDQVIRDLIEDNKIDCDFRSLSGCHGYWNQTYFDEAKQATSELKDWIKVIEDPDELHGKLALMPGVVGAIVQSRAASLSPYKLVIWMWEDMLKRYEKSGRLNLQTETPVERISKGENGSGYVLHTLRGTIEAQQVILATNGYTSHLLEEFEDLIIPTQAQMSTLGPPWTLNGCSLKYSYDFNGIGQQDRVMSDYLVQNPVGKGGQLMFGGGRAEVPGHGVGVSDDSFVEPTAENYLRHLTNLLNFDGNSKGEINTGKMLHLDASWTGIIGHSKDHYPWVGGVPNSEGLWISAGYTGHGMTRAGLCGRHVAKLAIAKFNGEDWRKIEQKDVEMGKFPREYVSSKMRMSK